MDAHQLLDGIVAAFLAANPTARPSSSTVYELIQWSHANMRAVAVTPREAPPKCSGCGEFLSAERVAMRIDRCSDCDGRRRKGRRGGG